MPDSTNNTWIDATFIEPLNGKKDTNVQLKLASADNIGSYSMPVIFKQVEVSLDEIDTNISYFQEFNTISGIKNIAIGYKAFDPPKIDGVLTSLVEFSTDYTITSGILYKPVIYTTGYNTISGAIDRRIVFTGGREMLDFKSVNTNTQFIHNKDMSKDWWVNYIDFSGNLTSSGTPIPFYYSNRSFVSEYGKDFDDFNFGWRDNKVDISFAGWIGFPIYGDVYSTIEGFNSGYKFEATTISGNIDIHYIDLYSTLLSTSGINCDLYCALNKYIGLNAESETIDGRIGYMDSDIYSTVKKEIALTLDISLLSLKISNFSLEIGEYTTASGFIYVDITDDECLISTSNTYFMVDGNRVSVTFDSIEDGYRMFYNPEDNFASIEGATVFTVHAENECNKTLEQEFYLTFGYIVEYINYPELSDSIDYGFQQKIIVRVTAENYASCPQVSSLAWDFESKSQANVDLGASIVGRFHAWEYNEMPAIIYPHSAAYFYGKEFKVVIKAKDFAGNQMEPLVLNYKIEDKPIKK